MARHLRKGLFEDYELVQVWSDLNPNDDDDVEDLVQGNNDTTDEENVRNS